MKKIIDLIAGDKISMDVLVVSKTIAMTKSNKEYCKITVRDSSGDISGNIWDYDKTKMPFEAGKPIQLTATVDTYKDKNQIKVHSITPSIADISTFGAQTRFDIDQMWNNLATIVAGFKEPLTKFVAEEMLLNNLAVVEAFKKAPAATGVHNNWFGGLLEHVWSLCTMAEPLIIHYQKNYRETLSRDKVLFGLLMHDIGKIVEYDYTNPSFPKTGLGILTNHIVLGPSWVYEKANKFMDEWLAKPHGTGDEFKFERAHLMHILVAHHGKTEWGSPIVPATLEALLVHHLDNLDSKMMHAIGLIEKPDGPVKGFSERSYFERTSFYKG